MSSKYTNSVPILTKREKETIDRFENFNSSSAVLKEFFMMGFKSFDALKSIMRFYYPDIDLKKLKKLWNCVSMEREIVEKINVVFEKLKSE